METLDLKEILNNIYQKRMLIFIITILMLIIGGIYSCYFVIPKYSSSSTFILTKDALDEVKTEIGTEGITESDITLNSKLIDTYSEIIKSNSVLTEVVNNLNIKGLTETSLREKIKVEAVSQTDVIKITATDTNAENAAKIANEIVKIFGEKVVEIYSINNITLLDTAKVSNTPSNINHIKDIAIFGFIGVVLSIVVIFLIVYFEDSKIKNVKTVEKSSGINVIANIEKIEDKNELITLTNIQSSCSESFKMLRTNLLFSCEKKDIKTILITSCVSKEGKSWVASNLAVTFARTGKKILIIDADLRKGRLHQIFELKQKEGLAEILSTKNNEYNIQKTFVENLDVLTCGANTEKSSELLLNNKMKSLLDNVKQNYDYIIIDATPTLLITDAVILSRIVDASLIVSKYGYTQLEDVERIKKEIEKVRWTSCRDGDKSKFEFR